MTAKEFNRDFWVIYQDGLISRRPISYSLLSSLLGSKFPKVLSKVEQNVEQKLIVRPFHGVVVTFYRH